MPYHNQLLSEYIMQGQKRASPLENEKALLFHMDYYDTHKMGDGTMRTVHTDVDSYADSGSSRGGDNGDSGGWPFIILCGGTMVCCFCFPDTFFGCISSVATWAMDCICGCFCD